MTVTGAADSETDILYSDYVNPQWSRLLGLLQMNVRYQRCSGCELFTSDGRRILTWSDDHTARLWDAATGRQIGPALQHRDTVNGAQFNRDESRILTWSDDKTARVWLLNADLDFPAGAIDLWVEAMTGSEMDLVTQEVKTLDPTGWHEIRRRYEAIAADHAKNCKYPDANEWLREQKELGH
jgi:WD40 repeat protein